LKILMRNQKSERWKLVESAAYGAEAELQSLLASSPSLIPVDEIREGVSPLVVAVCEFGLTGSGNTDLLAFSAEGDIAIVECKLAANAEIKRKVIGQVLEYGAYLWNMTYEEVDQRVNRLRGKSLADLVAESIEDSEWDEENFRSNVQDALTRGAFVLIIAVDEMNEELSRTIKFLNGCGNPAFSFNALEMRRFQASGTEILVPDLHGPLLQATKPKGERKQWTEELFFQSIQEELLPEVVQVISDLYKWSVASADRIFFGTGKGKGSFTFHYLKDRKAFSVFSVYTDGYLCLNYGWLSPKVKPSVIEEFHQAMHSISSLKDIPANFSAWHSTEIATAFLNQPGTLEQFKAAVESLGHRIHSEE